MQKVAATQSFSVHESSKSPKKPDLSIVKEVFSEISDIFETECKREKVKQDFLTEILEEIAKAKEEIIAKDLTIKNSEKQIQELQKSQIELNNTRKIVENLERKLKEKEQENSNLNEAAIEFNKNLEKTKKMKITISKEKEKVEKRLEEYENLNNENRKLIETLEIELDQNMHFYKEKNEELLKKEKVSQEKIMTLADEKENLLEELYKKDQLINSLTNELEQMNDYKKDSEEFRIRNNKVQEENNYVLEEIKNLRNNYQREKNDLIEENQSLLRETEKYKKNQMKNQELIEELMSKEKTLDLKSKELSKELAMKEEKLKEKNKKLRTISTELQSMNERVVDFSKISDNLISENEFLKKKLNDLTRKNELSKLQQENIAKMKMNNAYRRTQELEKLTSTLDTIYLNNFNNGGSTTKF